MFKLLKTNIGRLRITGFLEGLSLVILVFIAVPMKYFWDNPVPVKIVGPIHGGLFLLFVINTFSVSAEQKWSFNKTTWKVLLSSFIPFGTFYVDKKILSRIQPSK